MNDRLSILVDKNYQIYIHQNILNLKIYVGVTTHIQDRWANQKWAAFNINYIYYNSPFYKAIRKYGWDNFTHQVIENHINKQEALDAERFWIEYFRSNIKVFGTNYGYNQSRGGEDIAIKGWEIRDNLSKRMSGNKNHMFGKPRTDEVKRKISYTKKLNSLSKEQKEILSDFFKVKLSEEQIKNICLDVRSQSEIAKSFGVSRTVIRRILAENEIVNSLHKTVLKHISKEQLVCLLKKDLTCNETARRLNVSPITLYRKIKLLLNADGFVSAKSLVKNETISNDSNNQIIISNT